MQLVRVCAQFASQGDIRIMLRPSALPVQLGAIRARTRQAARHVRMVSTVKKVQVLAYSVRMVALPLMTALHASPGYSEVTVSDGSRAINNGTACKSKIL